MYKLVNYADNEGGGSFLYETQDLNGVTNRVGAIFSGEGYKLESGAPDNGTYGIGNQTMRLLLGAFHKRHTFSVKIYMHDENHVRMDLIKMSSGWSGGLIGVSQVKKELARIKQVMQKL